MGYVSITLIWLCKIQSSYHYSCLHLFLCFHSFRFQVSPFFSNPLFSLFFLSFSLLSSSLLSSSIFFFSSSSLFFLSSSSLFSLSSFSSVSCFAVLSFGLFISSFSFTVGFSVLPLFVVL